MRFGSLLLASLLALSGAARIESLTEDGVRSLTEDAIEVCGIGSEAELDHVAPVIGTARGQEGLREYRLPEKRLYICGTGKPQPVRAVAYTPEREELTASHVARLFDGTLAALFGKTGDFLFVLDAGGNLVVAPIWQGADGTEEVKHGDLTPGSSAFDRPEEEGNKDGEKRVSGHYRGKARLGGEFIRDESGIWSINQKSGYSLQRLPLSLRASQSEDPNMLPEDPLQKLEPIADIHMMKRFGCYLRSLGIEAGVHGWQACNLASRACEPQDNEMTCCSGLQPSVCQAPGHFGTHLKLEVWSKDCVLEPDQLDAKLSAVTDLLSKPTAAESAVPALRELFVGFRKSGCFEEARGDCDLPGVLHQVRACMNVLGANEEDVSPELLAEAARCWTEGGASELVENCLKGK